MLPAFGFVGCRTTRGTRPTSRPLRHPCFPGEKARMRGSSPQRGRRGIAMPLNSSGAAQTAEPDLRPTKGNWVLGGEGGDEGFLTSAGTPRDRDAFGFVGCRTNRGTRPTSCPLRPRAFQGVECRAGRCPCDPPLNSSGAAKTIECDLTPSQKALTELSADPRIKCNLQCRVGFAVISEDIFIIGEHMVLLSITAWLYK